MAKKIYVGKIYPGTTDQELSAHFSKAGKVIQAEISRNRLTGNKENFGYVLMSNDYETAEAIKLNNSELKKSRIMVKEAHYLDQDRSDYGYRRYRR